MSNSRSWPRLFSFRVPRNVLEPQEEGGRAHLHAFGKTPRTWSELRPHIGASSPVPRVGRQNKRKKKGINGNGEGSR